MIGDTLMLVGFMIKTRDDRSGDLCFVCVCVFCLDIHIGTRSQITTRGIFDRDNFKLGVLGSYCYQWSDTRSTAGTCHGQPLRPPPLPGS